MLVLDNVSVSYGAIEALRGISMRVEQGEALQVKTNQPVDLELIVRHGTASTVVDSFDFGGLLIMSIT